MAKIESRWGKIDWYCSDCGEYWMTTENCSPFYKMKPDCECPESDERYARAFCHECGHDLQMGVDLCYHFTSSMCQAV